MKKHALMTLGLVLLIGVPLSADDKDDATKKDMKKLEGNWNVESVEANGQKLSPDQVGNIKLTIKGNQYNVDLGERKLELTFKIDPTKKPKAIDFTLVMGNEKTETQGIYEVTDDTFKLCRTMEGGQERPKEFAAKEGSGTMLIVYKRQK